MQPRSTEITPWSSRRSGEEGELIAAEYLQRLGYTIIERNYRFGRDGEIDIVARDGDVLVFCEVKTRTNDRYGDPEYAITKKKQSQMRYMAKAYLYENEISDQECRFDVVAIKIRHGRPDINYFKGAF